jgi:hypothetical protein
MESGTLERRGPGAPAGIARLARADRDADSPDEGYSAGGGPSVGPMFFGVRSR